jgi:hypothetical protein
LERLLRKRKRMVLETLEARPWNSEDCSPEECERLLHEAVTWDECLADWLRPVEMP